MRSLRIHSYFDNVVTKFMINNRTDVHLLNVQVFGWCHIYFEEYFKFAKD